MMAAASLLTRNNPSLHFLPYGMARNFFTDKGYIIYLNITHALPHSTTVYTDLMRAYERQFLFSFLFKLCSLSGTLWWGKNVQRPPYGCTYSTYAPAERTHVQHAGG